MVQEKVDLHSIIVKCPKCGEANKPGVFRCTKCNASLRPTLLAVVTLLGPIILVLLAIASLGQIGQNPAAILAFLINTAGIAILIGLRYGRYWAWVAIHVVWVINILSSAIQALAINPEMLFHTAVQTLIIVLFFFYFHSKRVKAFCSVGRST